jgi:beta-lactamase class A
LIAILKRSESDPALLTRPMTFGGGFDANSLMRFPPATTLTPGATYTVGELCRRMVRDSDNNATALLNTIVPRAEFDATLRGLGLDPDQIRNHGAVGIKSLTAFLRVLYNASYLDRATSEQALEMLSRASFRDGIVAGVPAGVAVAAKYGEYEPDPSSVQLHEFAIVYHARAPYLLGVMTAGYDYASLKRVIRDVSAAVYRGGDEGIPAR